MNKKIIRGYKVFNPDWTCKGKQYTCPGKFEEPVELSICERGMHFCKKAVDCFNYYSFDSRNKVAEVIAFVDRTVERDDKCATNHLEIVREINWHELLEIVNIGNDNDGLRNTGNKNSGDGNSGDRNNGNRNSGNRNSGDGNSGYDNSGNWNSGNKNFGNNNTGSDNFGYKNSGDENCGSGNSGDKNCGDGNSGDWNITDHSSGCFNTTEEKIRMFNKPSDWTYSDWRKSSACYLLSQMPGDILEYMYFENMTDVEKEIHPEAKVTGGYLRAFKIKSASIWWSKLDANEKFIIKSIPNFDKKIFKRITGIDVDAE